MNMASKRPPYQEYTTSYERMCDETDFYKEQNDLKDPGWLDF